MGFGQGVSGINAAAANLDVIGNNIANANTVGYKQSTAQFADVYAGTKIGLGTSVNSVVQSFSQGNIESSGSSLDVAITNGMGFYRMVSSDGSVFYSRNGQFQKQADGRLTNAQGLQLTGYPAGVAGGGGVKPQPLVISNAQMQPKATSTTSAQFNLNSGSTVPATAFVSTPAALPTQSMFNYSTGITVYDSLGNAQQLTAYFSKQAAGPGTAAGGSDWQMNITDAAGNLVSGPAGAPAPIALQFSSSGLLTSPTPAALASFTLPAANGAAALTSTIDLSGTTQFGAANDTKSLTQNGYTSGSLLGFAMQQDGTILGSYSNQQTQSLGQVVLAGFGNVQGLQPQGNNVWSATGSSGQELIATPGGSLGQLKSNAVEDSNVDLSGQLVNLIVAQRNYQANAQTIKAQDTVMQTLVNL
ncbi:flagellar hook protein FlgE [Cupriavidus basilensis]|uniref:flagellar hook protein FlgE n=1 Tax=Cupriavidus basilensis TaxID=68895 RepID=UPI0020A6B658|nr:flagellar hook protein FlgE [Cupriavidus basilensis]MCP3021678.1 flagellar hook protein FlgE [Cupriavidus basilensis]